MCAPKFRDGLKTCLLKGQHRGPNSDLVQDNSLAHDLVLYLYLLNSSLTNQSPGHYQSFSLISLSVQLQGLWANYFRTQFTPLAFCEGRQNWKGRQCCLQTNGRSRDGLKVTYIPGGPCRRWANQHDPQAMTIKGSYIPKPARNVHPNFGDVGSTLRGGNGGSPRGVAAQLQTNRDRETLDLQVK